ncbi:MAG: N-(5'-phosphoribosyl)anthranilate isomerase [Armatimonadota bacterium]|nr:MAG: N-(5'-phosphoribosyl)anthranilate isomerase [Armatimonadota bacterium]
MVRVKICGITNIDDLQAAVRWGAHAVGFVFEPSSPRYAGGCGDLLEMLRSVPPFVARVAVYAHLPEDDEHIWEEVDAVQYVQVHSRVSLPPHVQRVQAVRLRTEQDVELALSLQSEVDALLVDTYHPHKMGGTGEQSDWRLARLLREEAKVPVILAGGLTPDNVQDAIRQVMPYAVDVSSGVESAPGKKDHQKIKEFIANVRRFANGS